MKFFVCVLLLAVIVTAEPPFRQRFYKFQRQEIEADVEKQEPNNFEAAPYPAAGYRPSQEFNLPSRQEVAPPSTSYGVPDDSYSAPVMSYTAPQVLYGVPQTEYGVPEKEGEVEDRTGKPENQAEEKQSEQKPKEGAAEKLTEEPKQDAEVVSNQGVYYVLLPDSQLQRVQFQTENDIRNMAYTARLQYKNEDRAPVYIYTTVPQYQSAAYVQWY
ncbi:unnamed protein product [Arctia plantaginis]|uniref:DUF4794 domain-containing protein n=1 Tax=Arctia plantaginis TaxID=874455 RepID=A0A8S1AGB0_ARCPL|nr:unnamed protein product [Arctia plantaginis]